MLLSCTAAVAALLIICVTSRSVLVDYWRRSSFVFSLNLNQDTGGMVCDILTLDSSDEQVGTFCLQITNDLHIRAEISLDPTTTSASEHSWKVQVAYLQMGKGDDMNLEESRILQHVPESDQVQDNLIAFEDIAIADDLDFSCSRSGDSFTANTVMVFNNGENATHHDLITVDATLSFAISCNAGLRDSSVVHILKIIPVKQTSVVIHKEPHSQTDDNEQQNRNADDEHRNIGITEKKDTHQRRLPSTDWLGATRRTDCPATNDLIRNPNTLLDETFLRKAYISEYLSGKIAYDRHLIEDLEQYQQIYEYFYAWDDGEDDVAVVVKIEDVCYGAFRGTDPSNLRDLIIQNLDPGAGEILSSNCFVRAGYHQAYFTDYRADFESKLQTCIDSCDGESCEVIFTGGSQGAGPAVVAAVVYQDINPLVITWGGVKVLYRLSPYDETFCEAVKPQNHYRMILTDETIGLIDLIPHQWAFFADHIGHCILYDDDDLNYLGFNPRIDRSIFRYNIAVHTPLNYNFQTRLMYEDACLPCPAQGWIDGHWCSVDGECESGLCHCKECKALFNAESRCQRDEQCESGVCNMNLERCTAASGLMENDMLCRDDEDCSSGRCVKRRIPLTGSKCRVQLKTGVKCEEDSDCQSGVCGGFFFRKRCWPED